MDKRFLNQRTLFHFAEWRFWLPGTLRLQIAFFAGREPGLQCGPEARSDFTLRNIQQTRKFRETSAPASGWLLHAPHQRFRLAMRLDRNQSNCVLFGFVQGRHSLMVAPTSTPATRTRSEEHTSELQSRQYLVCRLLLEK